jgi:hypothetical protein
MIRYLHQKLLQKINQSMCSRMEQSLKVLTPLLHLKLAKQPQPKLKFMTSNHLLKKAMI